MPSSCARLDAHGSSWHRQLRGEKTDQLLVCSAIDRRSRNPNLEGIAVNADTGGARSLGLDMNREDGSVLAVL